MGIFGGRLRGGCSSEGRDFVQPRCQPTEMHSTRATDQNAGVVLAESGMQGAYDTSQARVALRDGSSGTLSITSSQAPGEAAAFRRATAAPMGLGNGAPVVDLAASDNIVVTGTEIHQHVENVPVRVGRRRVVYQPHVVNEVVERRQMQSQSVYIDNIPDGLGRLQLSLGSHDRAFIDLQSIGKNCLINLEKTPGSAGKAVLIFGNGRPVESISYDRAKGVAVIKIGGQEISVTGIASPQDLLIATSAVDASQGVLADIGAVSDAVASRGAPTTPRAEPEAAPDPNVAQAQPSPSDQPSPEYDGKLAEKDRLLTEKEQEIVNLKTEVAMMRAQMDEMKQQMEEMRRLLAAQSGTPQGATPEQPETPPATPGGSAPNEAGPADSAPPTPAPESSPESAPPAPEAAPPGTEGQPPATPSPEQSNEATPQQQPPAESARPAQDIDYEARAQAMYQELSWWTGGAALGLSSQLKVMHQVNELTPQQAAKLRERYQQTFNRDLVEDIDNRLSVGRAAALKAKLVAFSPQELAKLMQSNIDAPWYSVDDPEVLVDIITNLPFEQRQVVSAEFEKLTGKSIIAKLREDWGLFDRTTIVAPFVSGRDIKGLTEAAELYQLMNGAGANDYPLILATLQRGEASPAEIAQAFGTFYGRQWGKASLLEVLAAEVDQATLEAATRLINQATTE